MSTSSMTDRQLERIQRFKLGETSIGRHETIQLPKKVRENYGIREGSKLLWFAGNRDMWFHEDSFQKIILVVVERSGGSGGSE